MSKNSNEEKSRQLGMPHGTANGKLRKQILFHLVKKLNEDICFKCGDRIKTVDEFSIEHKIPWLHNSTELFWDLENIAFSHLSCNVPDRRGYVKLRKIRNENESWCTRCKTFLDKKLFGENPERWDGVSTQCKECSNNRAKDYRIRRAMLTGNAK